MGHLKHIIDPETGLCEICDGDAIYEVRQGKRPGKQYFYSNHDDRFAYHPNQERNPYGKDRVVYEMPDEHTPRYVQKSVYPTPTVRPRRVIYQQPPVEGPVVIRRKIVRRDQTPPEEVIIRRPQPRPTKFYYVDQEGQMLAQDHTPPPEPPRRYIVQSNHPPPPARTTRVVQRQPQTPPPPARTTRVVHRQPQTPPPPPREAWYSGPKRQINSDTEVIDRQHRMEREQSEYPQTPTSPIKPTMFHIQAVSNQDHQSPAASPTNMARYNRTPPPDMDHPGDRNRKQYRNYNEPEPQFERRVYKKLVPGRRDPPHDEYTPNRNQPRPVRNDDRLRPPVRHYASTPQLINRNNRNSPPLRHPSNYQRSVDDY